MNFIWTDRKRHLGLPVSFTKYMLTEDRLLMERGLFTTVNEEIQLFRVRDVKVVRTLGSKLFGCGTIVVYSSDHNSPEFHIHNVKAPLEVKEQLMATVKKARAENNIRSSELLGGGPEEPMPPEMHGCC